jgi:3-hydroxyisobutyrate dehydrogenase-like beta-hydroxyacid dehydrogenase
MPERLRVGYVGVGLMGHGAAKHILLKDFSLAVLAHRNRAPVEDLVARGALEARDIADLVGRSDVVFLCLPSAAEVEAIMLGVGGMAGVLRPGMVVVDKTTGDPALTRRLGALLAERGVSMIDAPIGRTPKEAEEGRLSTLLGGDPAVIARVRPVIEAYADTIIEAGPLGAALTVKIVNNFISFCNALVISETFAAAAKLGVDFRALTAMIEAGGSNSVMFQWIKPWILDGDDSRGRGRLAAGEKVLRSYLDLAKAGGAATVMGDAASSVLATILAAGHGDRYLPTLPGILAQLAGAPFRALEEPYAASASPANRRS